MTEVGLTMKSPSTRSTTPAVLQPGQRLGTVAGGCFPSYTCSARASRSSATMLLRTPVQRPSGSTTRVHAASVWYWSLRHPGSVGVAYAEVALRTGVPLLGGCAVQPCRFMIIFNFKFMLVLPEMIFTGHH